MSLRNTRQIVEDLRQHGRLIEINEPISPNLEMAEIQRRVYANRGPAILFSNPAGTSFPMVSNLFGSLEQSRFIFRETIERVRRAIELKIDPSAGLRRPWRYLSAPWVGFTMMPQRVATGPVLAHPVSLSQLPQLVSWPDDGGPFVTLPQVLSQAPCSQGKRSSLSKINLGMYRVQLAGNKYVPNEEVGLHYQIHRGIGVHHQAALAAGQPLPVAITVGGSPAMTLSAVMPLPEGMSELTFAGALAGHRIPMIVGPNHAPIYADADFVIEGELVLDAMKPEGPFGDHLGYYAKQHDFPFLRVRRVSHRPGAIWPFTVVGRPPQEDTTFGELIHEITGPIVPTVLPGVKAVHAVDAAGVHPLLLAIGSERYTPYRNPNRPQELLTQANAILGQGQMSLAKYLLIVNQFDNPNLDIQNIEHFLRHLLERVDFRRDLHFQTQTTIDTLDYSGQGFNVGSKVVIAASGGIRRKLSTELPSDINLPNGFSNPRICLPGVAVVESKIALESLASPDKTTQSELKNLIAALETQVGRCDYQSVEPEKSKPEIPLWIVVDDSDFVSQSLNNLLWATFTRSNPATDVYGLFATMVSKHWGCEGGLIIDARSKPHHAPPLIEDKRVSDKIDALAARGGLIAKFL
jgi:4-hydroxy-3-polyprenylbenzoate decarboxylase